MNNHSLMELNTKIYCLIFTTILFSKIAVAQPFMIAFGSDYNYSIDKYNNEVYYYFIPEFKIYRTELKTLQSFETEYPTVPQFANNSHLATYYQGQDVYLQDFERDTTIKILTKSNGFISTYVFSPNDSNILIDDRYYSLKDSQSHVLSFEINNWQSDYYEWNSDSTIINKFNNVILQYYLYSDSFDTLLYFGPNIYFTGASFNKMKNSLIYSLYELPPKLYSFDFNTSTNTILFDPMVDDSSQVQACWSAPIAISSISHSLDEERIGFFNRLLTNQGAGLYTIDSDSGYMNMFLDCSDIGLKYNMQWLSGDTIIYYDETNFIIFGIDVNPFINEVIWQNEEILPDHFNITNYPNPFNPNTVISYQLPNAFNVTLKVYDVLGNEIATLVNEEKPAGNYEVVFNAKNLSSGVYIYKIQAGSINESRKMILMK